MSQNQNFLNYDSARLQEIINYTPGGMHICYLSEPIHLEYGSDGLCRMLGYTRTEYESLTCGDYTAAMHEDDVEIFAKFVRQLSRELGSSTVEYRLIRKDGSVITVSDTMEAKIDADGAIRGYSSVTDITGLKNIEQKLLHQREEYKKLYHEVKISQERIQIISAASGIMFFEYDIAHGKFISFENTERVLGCSSSELICYLNYSLSRHENSRPQCIMEALIHPDDQSIWENAELEYGQDFDFYAEIRLGFQTETYRWFAVKRHMFADENGELEMGCIWDVDQAHWEFENLKRRAETDPMTGLLNKPSAYDLINHILNDHPEQTHALLFFDLDNFKQINDKLGHDKGDSVIHYTATLLRNLFPKWDVLARFGGDEFLAFLPNVSAHTPIIEKARCFNEMAMSCDELKGTGITFSASIGIVFSDGATSVKELCTRADQATYQAKNNGKGCVEVFTGK